MHHSGRPTDQEAHNMFEFAFRASAFLSIASIAAILVLALSGN